MNSEENIRNFSNSDIQSMNNFKELISNVHILRNEEFGCPWQNAQTHDSLIPFLLEESYEFINAMHDNNHMKMAEELGDILLQIMLHSEIGIKEKEFELNKVFEILNQKIKSRHPYIFKEKKKISYEEAKLIWHDIKDIENSSTKKKNDISSYLLSRIEKLPASLGTKIIASKVMQYSFKWKNTNQIFDKLKEEIEELKESIEENDLSHIKEEFGDIFFTLINLSVFLNINHETCLIAANKKFLERFSLIEKLTGDKINEQTFEDFQKLWKIAKKNL